MVDRPDTHLRYTYSAKVRSHCQTVVHHGRRPHSANRTTIGAEQERCAIPDVTTHQTSSVFCEPIHRDAVIPSYRQASLTNRPRGPLHLIGPRSGLEPAYNPAVSIPSPTCRVIGVANPTSAQPRKNLAAPLSTFGPSVDVSPPVVAFLSERTHPRPSSMQS